MRRLRFAFWLTVALCFALGAVLAVARGEVVIGLAILGGMAWGLARPRAAP
jgi:hypothetical protein